MSAKQTPGRVKVQHPHAGPRGWEVAFEPGLEQLCQDITEDNARRLVACWNACEGINTELLENAPYKDSAAFMGYLKMEGQRDLMLAALREALPVVEKLQDMIAKHHPGFTLRQTAIVRDAIASAEGGAPAPQKSSVVQQEPVVRIHTAVTGCDDCPACVYETAGRYSCEKAGYRKFDADGKAAICPDWCPLPLAHPAQQAKPQPLTAMVDAAMVEMQNITPPLRRSECERLIRAALDGGQS